MHTRISLVTGLLASLALAGAEPVQASDRRDAAIAGAVGGGVIGGVIGANSRLYYAPPPQVRYYPPHPGYYEPPIYYRPHSVVIGPRYYPYRPHHYKAHRYHHPHKHWRGHKHHHRYRR